MEEKHIDIELQKREDAERFDAAKLSAKQRRKIRKTYGLSYSDLLRQKFRQQNLERINKG